VNNISKITIAFCEGPHDTAFLYRILKTKCFISFKDTLDKLPKVIGDFIMSKNKIAEYNLLKIDSLKNDFVPYKIMHKEEELILLYSLGGDKDGNRDENNKRLIILNHFLKNIKVNVEDTNNMGEAFIAVNSLKQPFKYKFLFFYDADNDKNEKLNIVNTYLRKINIENTLKHNEIITKDGYSIGAYIFSDDEDKGSLEDILFSLMKIGNEVCFNKATEYYREHLNKDNDMQPKTRTKRLSTECIDGVAVDKRKDSKQEDEKKSVICIAGQLQKKGKSNVVVIEDSDYLNLDKINSSKKVQEIADFLNR